METIEVKTNTNRMKKVMFGIVVLFILCTIGLLIYLYPFASSEKEPYVNKKYSILLNGKIQDQALIEGKNIYIPIKVVHSGIDDSVFTEKQSVIITTNQKVIQIPINKKTYFINQKPVHAQQPIIKNMNNQLFIDLKTLIGI